MAIQADGKIVAVGSGGGRALPDHIDPRFALARYNSDGTLDATFGGDGKVMTDFSRMGGMGLAGWPSRRTARSSLSARRATAGLNPRFALARYNSDGTLDATFGGDGKVETDFTPRGDGAAGVAIQADGRIVAAGMANSGRSKIRVALARYLAQ